MLDRTTITSRTRNLRFAYSTAPAGYPIAAPAMPGRCMTVKEVEAAAEEAIAAVAAAGDGHQVRAALWVGDKRVRLHAGITCTLPSDISFAMDCARKGGADVEFEPKWQ